MAEAKMITQKELYRLVAKKAKGFSEAVARRYIEALMEVILEELVISGKVRIPNFGLFSAKVVGGYEKRTPNYPGSLEITTIYMEPRWTIKFKPAEKIKTDLNEMKAVGYYREEEDLDSKLQEDIDEDVKKLDPIKPTRAELKKELAKLQEEKKLRKQLEIEEKMRQMELEDYKARKHYSNGKQSARRI